MVKVGNYEISNEWYRSEALLRAIKSYNSDVEYLDTNEEVVI